MAQASRVMRVVLVPLVTDDAQIAHLFTLPSLVAAATNGWFLYLYAAPQMFGNLTPPNPGAVQKVLRVELVTSTTNDANLVTTTLPGIQSDLGLTSPLITWSMTVTEGY